MLNQEEIYQLIFKEDWKTLLDILYNQKDFINSEPSLLAAAQIFEQQFVRNLTNYSSDREDIKECLETLYLLDHADFYKMMDKNRKIVFDQLAVRSPKEYYYLSEKYRSNNPKDAVQTSFFPENIQNETNTINDQPVTNWIEIFNRLFELINVSEDPATYFSGPRLINLIRKFDAYHPDYMQYIEMREKGGLSKTRKVYYQDLLESLKPNVRKSVIGSILDIVRPFDQKRVSDLEILLYGKRIDSSLSDDEFSKKPIAFISYSWDDETHKSWVLDLANRLIRDGVDVRIDRHINRVGSSLQYNMEQSIAIADKVIVIFTPGYKEKADNREGGVGYEYSILNIGLYNNQTVNKKIIPVLRGGDREKSIPSFMQQYIHINLSQSASFSEGYIDLKHAIFDLTE